MEAFEATLVGSLHRLWSAKLKPKRPQAVRRLGLIAHVPLLGTHCSTFVQIHAMPSASPAEPTQPPSVADSSIVITPAPTSELMAEAFEPLDFFDDELFPSPT